MLLLPSFLKKDGFKLLCVSSEVSPQAHLFGHLIPSWWCCLGYFLGCCFVLFCHVGVRGSLGAFECS